MCEDFFLGDWCPRSCLADYFKNLRENEVDGLNEPNYAVVLMLTTDDMIRSATNMCLPLKLAELDGEDWKESFEAIQQECFSFMFVEEIVVEE